MRKQNGMTIIEILISISLIALVITLLFSMLIQVRNEDVANQVESNFIINQSTFTKAIEEDMINYGVSRIDPCSYTEAGIDNTTQINFGKDELFKCIKITYAANYTQDNIGFVIIYDTYAKYDVENGNYKGVSDSATWMIQYTRGHYEGTKWTPLTHIMKTIPDEVNLDEQPYLYYTNSVSPSINGASLVIPISNLDGEHYDLNLSFTFVGNTTFKCGTSTDNKKKDKLTCICKSGNLC